MTTQTRKNKEEQEKRYRTKKIFWLFRSWRIWFNMILATLWFLIVFGGLGMLIQQWNTAKNDLKQYQALQVFLRVDDFAHTQINTMTMTGVAYGFTWIEEFEEIDNKFHSAKAFEEKFKYTQEMEMFLGKLNTYLNDTIGIKTPEDWLRQQTYSQIHNVFLQTQETLYPSK